MSPVLLLPAQPPLSTHNQPTLNDSDPIDPVHPNTDSPSEQTATAIPTTATRQRQRQRSQRPLHKTTTVPKKIHPKIHPKTRQYPRLVSTHRTIDRTINTAIPTIQAIELPPSSTARMTSPKAGTKAGTNPSYIQLSAPNDPPAAAC